MSISFIGAYKNKSYQNFFLDVVYGYAPQQSFELEGKYLTTQFQHFSFLFTHYQETPVFFLDSKISEIRPIISLECPYEKVSLPNYVHLNGNYKINNYSELILNGKYTNSVQRYFKLESKFLKRKYSEINFLFRNLNSFIYMSFVGKYYKNREEERIEKSIAFVSVYLKNVTQVTTISGFLQLFSLSVNEINQDNKNVILTDIVQNVYLLDHFTFDIRFSFIDNFYNIGRAIINNLILVQGIESPITTFTIKPVSNVGTGLFEIGNFSAVKEEVGGFISSYFSFVVRREIKDYDVDSVVNVFGIKLLFKNVKFKNLLQNFNFVDVWQDFVYKQYDLFNFFQKVRKWYYVEDLKNNNLYFFDKKILYYNISSVEIVFDVIVDTSNALELSVKKTDLFYFYSVPKFYINSLQCLIDLMIPFKELSSIITLEAIQPLESADVYLTSENIFNIPYAALKDIFFKESFLPVVGENIVDDTPGNKFVINLHRYVYSSSEFVVYNAFLTSQSEIVDIESSLEYVGNFNCIKSIEDNLYFIYIAGYLNEKVNIGESVFFGVSLDYFNYTIENSIINIGKIAITNPFDKMIEDNKWGAYFELQKENVGGMFIGLFEVRF